MAQSRQNFNIIKKSAEIVLPGPRQAGKTTMLCSLVEKENIEREINGAPFVPFTTDFDRLLA